MLIIEMLPVNLVFGSALIDCSCHISLPCPGCFVHPYYEGLGPVSRLVSFQVFDPHGPCQYFRRLVLHDWYFHQPTRQCKSLEGSRFRAQDGFVMNFVIIDVCLFVKFDRQGLMATRNLRLFGFW